MESRAEELTRKRAKCKEEMNAIDLELDNLQKEWFAKHELKTPSGFKLYVRTNNMKDNINCIFEYTIYYMRHIIEMKRRKRIDNDMKKVYDGKYYIHAVTTDKTFKPSDDSIVEDSSEEEEEEEEDDDKYIAYSTVFTLNLNAILVLDCEGAKSIATVLQ
jgi:hypothetical protein